MRWVIQNIPRSCNLNGCEIVKFLNECNPGELDIEALFDVLAEKAKDDLFLKCSYAPPRSIIPMNMNVKCVRHFSTRSTNNVKNLSEKNKKNVKLLSQIKEEDAVYVTCARPHLGGLVAHTDGGVAFVCEVKMRFMVCSGLLRDFDLNPLVYFRSKFLLSLQYNGGCVSC
jgi:hypothetical protein